MTELGHTYRLGVDGIYGDWWKLDYYSGGKRPGHFFFHEDGKWGLRMKLSSVAQYSDAIERCPDAIRQSFENSPPCARCQDECPYRLSYSLGGVAHETCVYQVFIFTDLRTGFADQSRPVIAQVDQLRLAQPIAPLVQKMPVTPVRLGRPSDLSANGTASGIARLHGGLSGERAGELLDVKQAAVSWRVVLLTRSRARNTIAPGRALRVHLPAQR
jgi:hypothetical protein